MANVEIMSDKELAVALSEVVLAREVEFKPGSSEAFKLTAQGVEHGFEVVRRLSAHDRLLAVLVILTIGDITYGGSSENADPS